MAICPDDQLALLSGAASFELVQKVLMAAVPVLVGALKTGFRDTAEVRHDVA